MSKKYHWENVYRRERSTELGWYQAAPDLSLQLIREAGIEPAHRVIDVGGGTSFLVDQLLNMGFKDVTVLDLSITTLLESQERLGDRANRVSWIGQDVTTFQPDGVYDLWHDRAVLHFLTRKRDRHRYRDTLQATLAPNGVAIIGTFALGGARRCAGLWVRRYGEDDIRQLFGSFLHLKAAVHEMHVTPGGIEQPYTYFVLRAENEAVQGSNS
jgi:2-polyprenyl-3-methyl-5-hydroxy-6-metoxy-1,4-benzoquinol methylase